VWSCTTRATFPVPPIASAMCLAASAAAALLLVAAVVSGMSLSTPESKAITGMFWARACCSSGAAARESSAAKPRTSGWRPSAFCSMVTWASTSDSLAGPSKLIRMPCSAASCSAPCLTACQNWCWKPLETMARYGWSPPCPSSDEPPHAAAVRAKAAAAMAAPIRWIRIVDRAPLVELGGGEIYWSGGGALARPVRVDGEQDHAAEDDVLPFLRDRHDLQPVVQHRDDQGADDRTDDRPLAAREGGPPDHDGGDRLQLVAHPGGRLRRAEAGGDHHPGQAGEQAGERVDDDLPAADVDPGERGGLLVAADGVGVAAEHRLVEQHARDHRRERQDQHRVREVRAGDDAADRDVDVGGRLVEVDRRAVGDDERETLRHQPHRERRDERRELEHGHVEAVDQPDQPAEEDRAEHADRQRYPGVDDQHAGHHGAQRHPGADRQVDPARDDHERGPERERADDDGREQDVGDVAVVEEVRAGHREEREDDDQAREREELLEPGPQGVAHARGHALLLLLGGGGGGQLTASVSGRMVAKCMTFSWVASAASSCPVTRPSLITTIRCDMRSTSGSSEEIMMIDLPWAASSLSSR